MGSIVAPNAVAQKLNWLLWAPQASGFLLVDRQLQTAHEPLNRRQHFRCRGFAKHTEVIGEVHDLRAEVLGITQRFPAQYEAPHVNVTQQGRDRGALRGSEPNISVHSSNGKLEVTRIEPRS